VDVTPDGAAMAFFLAKLSISCQRPEFPFSNRSSPSASLQAGVIELFLPRIQIAPI